MLRSKRGGERGEEKTGREEEEKKEEGKRGSGRREREEEEVSANAKGDFFSLSRSF